MTTELRRIEVYGTVQGVGFRPFAHRLATSLGLAGWVRNEDGHVVSLVAGTPAALTEYAARLNSDAPPLAVVTAVRSLPATVDEMPEPGFTVLASTSAVSDLPREIPPDAATCPDCLRDDATYEGEAAIALEQAAGTLSADPLPWRIVSSDGLWVYDPAPTLAAVLDRAGEPGPVAAAFHTTLAEVTGALVAEAVRESGADTVCLSGGCFQNRRLLTEVHDNLTRQGLRVLANSAVPANDGGISYGQAAIGAARLAARKET